MSRNRRLAMTHVVADWIAVTRMIHLSYAAVVWVAAVLVRAVGILASMCRLDVEDS